MSAIVYGECAWHMINFKIKIEEGGGYCDEAVHTIGFSVKRCLTSSSYRK
jgi:hypothetical protein